MPTVYRMAVRTTRSEQRGKFKVTIDSREGTYALSVPQTVFGRLMYQVIRKMGKPLILNFGRRNALQLDLNLKGIRPLGKTARKALTYTPLRPRKKTEETTTRNKKSTTKKQTKETKPSKTATPPAPKIPEVTSAVQPTEQETKHNKNKSGKTKGSRNKKAVATAA